MESKSLITAEINIKGAEHENYSEEWPTYRQVGDYFIPSITLPDDGEYQIGKYGRMRPAT